MVTHQMKTTQPSLVNDPILPTTSERCSLFRVYLKKDSGHPVKTFKFQTIWRKSEDAKIGALFPSSG